MICNILRKHMPEAEDSASSVPLPPALMVEMEIAGLERYTLLQLQIATNNFSSKNYLGDGGSAVVFKGKIGKRAVAIKRPKISSCRIGITEFSTEISNISRLRHRNIISLVGFCFDETELLLVYELAGNNSVAYHLQPGKKEKLDWKTRKKIILGTARGLAHLHREPGIVHRNIKVHNVLLDSEFEAKVAGFGLAKFYPDSSATHITTRVVGALGYIDPHYALSGVINSKTDVYSFGIFLLELITGVRVAGDEWAKFAKAINRLKETPEGNMFDDIVDHCLLEGYDHDEMTGIIACAAASIGHSPKYRPTMKEVIRVLEGDDTPKSFITQISTAPPPEISFTPSGDGQEIITSPSSMTIALYHDSTNSLPLSSSEELRIGFRKYTLQQLETATDNFSLLNEIGRGAYATVYKGDLGNGIVAIKKLRREDARGDEDFKTEINAISRVSHVNLIALIGYCIDGAARLLVYEFAPNGSLADHLRPGKRENLNWETRKKIILGTARGLEYLHDRCKPAIIHRDIKPANILLDSEFEAKVADLGIARLYSNSLATHISTHVRGTPGYIDPDYYFSSKLTCKSDVYSFGILLLVLITGLAPSEELDEAKKNLGRALTEQNYDGIADNCLSRAYDLDGMRRAAACAAASTLPLLDRPTMEEIIDVIRGINPPNDFIKKVIGKKKPRNFPFFGKTQK